MARRAKIKDASRITGLTEWELRTGANSGKYPHMRVGGPNGRIIFDIDLLEDHIKKIMTDNLKSDEDTESYGNIRKVK